jgi:hypothetical protein
LCEAKPLSGKLVDVWCGHPPQLAAAIRAQVAVANVIGKNENDVGFLLRCRWQGHEYRCADPREANHKYCLKSAHELPPIVLK